MESLGSLKEKWEAAEWQAQASLALEIGKLGSPEAEGFLAEVLRNDENYFVRGFAALALSGAKSVESILLLAEKLNREAIFQCDENVFVRAMCAEALGKNAEGTRKVGGAAEELVFRILRKALDDEPMVVEKAIPALGKLGDRDSVGRMYRATQEKLVALDGKIDLGPIALALCEMGLTEPRALGAYVKVLVESQNMEVAGTVMEKVGEFLRADPTIDINGKLSSAIRTYRNKCELAKAAERQGSYVDSVLGRVARVSYVKEKPLPEPRPVRLKLKSG